MGGVVRGERALYADAVFVASPVPRLTAMLGGLHTREMQAELARIAYDPCLVLLAPLTRPAACPSPAIAAFSFVIE